MGTHPTLPDFYTKTELPIRLAFFWMSSNVCSILMSFLAFGVLHMRGILDKAGWRWLFLIECVFHVYQVMPVSNVYPGYSGACLLSSSDLLPSS